MASPITPEIEDKLRALWKTTTVCKIALLVGINVTTLSVWFKKNSITPMTLRDLVTKELFRIHAEGRIIKYRPMAGELGCGQTMVREIVREYNLLDGRVMKKGPVKRIQKPADASEVAALDRQAKKIRDYELYVKETAERRASFAVYNQTGSPLLDQVRNVTTTKRDKTLNNGRF